MNNKVMHILTIMLIAICHLTAQTNLSPSSAATAQTFGTFSQGLDAVSWNPSILAYEKKTVQVPTEVDTVYRSYLLTTELEEQSNSIYVGYSITTLFTNDIKEVFYEDSLYVNLQSLKEDSAFNVIIDRITNHTTADFYLRLMSNKGYENTLTDTIFHSAEIDTILSSSEQFDHVEKEKYSHLELFNMGFMLSNSSTDANWINTNILNGSDRGELDDAAKNEIISIFPDDGWRINSLINYKAGLSIKNVAFQVTPDVYGEFVIPKGLFELAFDGNAMSEPIDFSSRKNQFQAVIPVAMSYGRQINVPLFNNFAQRTYFGVSAKYLTGLAYFESAFNTLSITPSQDTITIQADMKTIYSLAGASMEVDPEKSFSYSFNTDEINNTPPGSGYAFDLGLIMDINDQLTSSIAITNLLGKIKWRDGTAYEHRLKMNSQIPMDSLQSKTFSPDSSLSAGIEIDTNITISSFQTKYPGVLTLGAEYSLKEIKLASNLKFGFSNELGSSTTPRLSLGLEYSPLKIKWLSLLGGASVGGFEGFQWGSGISMRLRFLQFSCAYSEYGGMLNSAKGFSFSLSNSIVF